MKIKTRIDAVMQQVANCSTSLGYQIGKCLQGKASTEASGEIYSASCAGAAWRGPWQRQCHINGLQMDVLRH